MKPVIAITMGDAAGVGPEIIHKSLADSRLYEHFRPVVIGDASIMKRAGKIVDSRQTLQIVSKPLEAGDDPSVIPLLDLANLAVDIPFGRISAQAGKAAYEYVYTAVKMALKREIQAIVTAPLHKEAMNLGGINFAGHTEILGTLSQTKDYAMVLYSEPLKVIHVTTHVSMRQACDLIKKDRVYRVIELAHQAGRLFGIGHPRLAVAGLNPHAGEHGLFGKEELTEIAPAIESAQEKGLSVFGPIPPDTVFYRAVVKKEYDIVVCMYHDQGHVPMKLLAFETGVNVTVGLPFIRTSVDHGTAFDKAGQGTADQRSLNEALKLAADMAGRFKESLFSPGP